MTIGWVFSMLLQGAIGHSHRTEAFRRVRRFTQDTLNSKFAECAPLNAAFQHVDDETDAETLPVISPQ